MLYIIMLSLRKLRRKKNKCPVCNAKIRDFIVDIDAASVRCAQCESEVDANPVFTNSTVNDLAQFLLEDKREAILTKLVFERQHSRRTPRPLLYGLILLLDVPIAVFGIVCLFMGKWKYSLGAIVSIFLFTEPIIGCYRGKIPKWKKATV